MSNKIIFSSEFKNKSDQQKPREKLLKNGSHSLQLWELLALVLRTGQRHKGGHFEDVERLAKRLLAEGGFRGIFQQKSVPDLQENYQLYQSHSQILVAIAEISRRLHGRYEHFDVSVPERVAEKFKFLHRAKQEHVYLLHVDSRNRAIYQELIALGQESQVTVSFNDVLRSALWLGATRLIIIHNHPHTAPTPSRADLQWTNKLAKSAQDLFSIQLLDHLIIGKKGYYSFRQSGLLST